VIAIDSSVLVAIIRGESEAEHFLEAVEREECVLGAPTLVEARLWCSVNLKTGSSEWLEHFIEARPGRTIPFGREMADVAGRAFQAYGRGSGHPARLNFGDCMAYAVASLMRAPLLFKGGDFGHTDVMAHPASIRL
jgi:ribonuclease VapC